MGQHNDRRPGRQQRALDRFEARGPELRRSTQIVPLIGVKVVCTRSGLYLGIQRSAGAL